MSQTETGARRWWQVSGAWLGIGTSPGSLLLGALIASRHGGSVPLLSILLSYGLMFSILWFQGLLGLKPPVGEGRNLTALAPIYFGPAMQRILGAVIALGMIGWSGFNAGLGGAALGRLLGIEHWIGAVVILIPVLFLSLRGIRSWNGLAALATISVLALTGLIVLRLAAPGLPVSLSPGSPIQVVTDVAVLVGYISVFSVRAPDFTCGLSSRKDLFILINLLTLPVLALMLAGAGIFLGTGETDLVTLLASQGALSIGNLLIFLSILAPTFTTLFSGAPSLEAATGIEERAGMVIISLIAFVPGPAALRSMAGELAGAAGGHPAAPRRAPGRRVHLPAARRSAGAASHLDVGLGLGRGAAADAAQTTHRAPGWPAVLWPGHRVVGVCLAQPEQERKPI